MLQMNLEIFWEAVEMSPQARFDSLLASARALTADRSSGQASNLARVSLSQKFTSIFIHQKKRYILFGYN